MLLHDGESLEKYFSGWKHYQSYEEMGKRQPGSGLDQKHFKIFTNNIWKKYLLQFKYPSEIITHKCDIYIW